jgi:flavin reductase (DIM6/NTAB) family NADH-FMN oxidoreductase RutF
MRQMSETSAPLPRGVSEFEHAGLTMAPSRLVAAPRVAEARASLECKLTQVIRLKNHRGGEIDNVLLLGEAIAFHIDDRMIRDGRFDTAAAAPLARCGYQDYAVADRMIALARPTGGGDAIVTSKGAE